MNIEVKSEPCRRHTQEVVERNEFLHAEIDKYLYVDISAEDFDDTELRTLAEEQDDLIEKYDFSSQIFEENGLKGLKDVTGKILDPAIC